MRELELPDVQDVMLEYRKIKLLYRSALKEIGTKLEILNDEFKLVHQYNPIEHIESRLKTDESITRKLIRKGKEITVENIQKYIERYRWGQGYLFFYTRHLSNRRYDLITR